MIKFDKPKIILINLVLIAVGFVFIFWGASSASQKVMTILEAIGTGLIATGGVNLLDRLLTESPKPSDVSLVSMMRMTMDRKIHDQKDKATKIDILGVSVTDCLNEIIKDPEKRLIKNILNQPNTRVRILFVNPNSQFLHQRAFEDGLSSVEELKKRQNTSLESCVTLYKNILKIYNHAKEQDGAFDPMGTLSIKLIDSCPYITIERYDFDIYWGIYTSDTPGKKAPIFLTRKDENYDLYEKLKIHFVHLHDKDFREDADISSDKLEGDNFVVRVAQNGPWLNVSLVNLFLGPDRVKKLLE